MKRSLNPNEARRILSRVSQVTSFWLCTNEYLRNLDELGKSLEKATDEVFRYHVNKDKNDFEKWIRDVVNDKELAREISRIKTKETLVRKIAERVSELKVIMAKSKRVGRGEKRKVSKARRNNKLRRNRA
ncbi:hypothetical protein HYU11_04325 [Candidatus Woesearchaeota archaeon]|nr:hypothetical protein [Candidatus Woesearchaeota archaeon]